MAVIPGTGGSQGFAHGGVSGFPKVVNYAANGDSGDRLSHTMQLPSGLTFGNRIVCGIVLRNQAGAPLVWPSGWTEFCFFTTGGTGFRTGFAYRDLDGSEASTIAIVSQGSATAAMFAYQISGAHLAPPEANVEVITGSSSTTSSNPTAFSPSWGKDKTLWIAAYGNNEQPGRTLSTTPANYTNKSTHATPYTGVGACTREFEAVTEDPGTGIWSASCYSFGITIAIRPRN
jgi:hypothetical protein